MEQETFKYSVYGLNIDSQIECPGLYNSEDDTDVSILWGNVPESIEDPVRVTVLSQVKQGEFLIKAPGVASYFIENGTRITVLKYQETDMNALRIYLLGSALAGLLHQRAMFPFHGSSVNINGKTVLLCGPSGSGKSTLAAELFSRGNGFVSDDVSVIVSQDNQLYVQPGYPKFRLWKRSLKILNRMDQDLQQVRSGINKYNLDIAHNFISRPSRLYAIYYLDKNLNNGDIEVSPVEGAARYNELRKATFRKSLLAGHGRLKEHFELCTQISAQVDHYKVDRNPIHLTVQKIADHIENHCLNG